MNQSESLVEAIFTKCGLVYGRDFLGRWEGLNLAEVKADWARELGPLLNSPGAIVYGLERLPERPPTVLQFRSICTGYDAPRLAELPAPKADPDRVRQIMDGLKTKLRRVA